MGEFPAGRRFLVADDADIGEGFQLGDELLTRQGVERWLRQIGHGPEADRIVLPTRRDPTTKRIDSEATDLAGVSQKEVGFFAAREADAYNAVLVTRDDDFPCNICGNRGNAFTVGFEGCCETGVNMVHDCWASWKNSLFHSSDN